ncbi:MAG: hypothetical protein ACRD2T_01970, partial [Thermoanaerobaculia bacterium]
LDLDFSFRPNRWLSLQTRTFLDPNERFRFERNDSGVTVIPGHESLRATVGERFTRDRASFTYGLLGLDLSKKYLLEVYYAYDFELWRQSEVELRLIRVLHDWAVELVVGRDSGEDDNEYVSVNLMPVWLLADSRRRRDRATAFGR